MMSTFRSQTWTALFVFMLLKQVRQEQKVFSETLFWQRTSYMGLSPSSACYKRRMVRG